MTGDLTFAMVAGEASGDALGASLIREIRRHHPNARCYGIGGPKMLAEGFESLFPMERLSVMGLVEVLGRIRELLGIRRSLKKTFLTEKPDVFIGIDAPDFNLVLERQLKVRNIPTVHYVCPQAWAWRESRVKKIRRSVDHMLGLLPFEVDYYKKHAIPVTFVGHPMADQVPMEPDQQQARSRLGISGADKVVALLPGSRKMEVARLATVFLDTARCLTQNIPNITFVLPCASEARKVQIEPLLKPYSDLNILLTLGSAPEAMAAADAILIASGTATLEAALHKRPMVIAYKMAPLTFAIARRLVKISHVGLPNLLAKKPCIPELLQEEATPENLRVAMARALEDELWRVELVREFTDIHHRLKRDASVLAYQAILSVLQCNKEKEGA